MHYISKMSNLDDLIYDPQINNQNDEGELPRPKGRGFYLKF